jgi:hypothetical protein
LGWAEFKLDDTGSTLDSILAYARTINDQATDTSTRLRALFKQDKRADPVHEAARKELLDAAVEQLLEDSDLLKRLSTGGSTKMSVSGKATSELNQDDLRSVLLEAVKIAAERVEAKKKTVASADAVPEN